ncbi:molybdopterin-dependent oxidoreductase [Zobellella sp. An-6]|uniref:molybdopterin-dependent oxidoreductase n=1 Tax=Zobellella sp. An-6 TaxID=3400218 RepID=UPI004042086F
MLPTKSLLGDGLRRPLYFLCLLLTLCHGTLAAAEPLPAAQDPVLLSLTGKIGVTNAEGRADFDLAMLGQLPQHEFNTQTPWTDGSHHYRGVLLKDLLARVGAADGEKIRASALNQYHVDIDWATAARLPVLLATHKDGEAMKIRDKGPVWVLLPLSDMPALDTKQHHEMMIWQLRTLDIR